MAVGIMSLAYMGELAIVLNLAYVALPKTRYLEIAQSQIDRIKKQLDPNDGLLPETQKKLVALTDQLDGMFDIDRNKRQLSWIQHNGHGKGVEHSDFLAGPLYDFFFGEEDKKWAEWTLLAAGVGIPGITLFHKLAPVDASYEATVWWGVFALFSFANVLPFIFIILGRMMKNKIMKCGVSAQLQYNAINAAAIEQLGTAR